MGWFGLGKKRTKFGKWIDSNGISQGDVADWAGVGRNTVGRICNEEDYKPTLGTVNKIISALKKNGHNASSKDLFG